MQKLNFEQETFYGNFYTTEDKEWALLKNRWNGYYVIYLANKKGTYDNTGYQFDKLEDFFKNKEMIKNVIKQNHEMYRH